MYSLSDYEYSLPGNTITQFPAIPADTCKFLLCKKNNSVSSDKSPLETKDQSRSTYTFHDAQFSDIADLLTPNDVLVFNNTKVIKARVPLENVRVVNQV